MTNLSREALSGPVVLGGATAPAEATAASRTILERFGWTLDSGGTSPVFGDAVLTGPLDISRIWSQTTALTAVRDGSSSDLNVLMTVEGAATLSIGDAAIELDVGSMIITESSTRMTATAGSGWARLEWRLGRTILGQPRFGASLGRRLQVPEAYSRALTSYSNAILGSSLSPEDAGLPFLLSGVEHAVVAAVAEALHLADGAGRASEEILRRAFQVIDGRFRDHSFTVAALSQDLSTSHTHLYRSFRAIGSTPRAELERRRVAAAVDALAAGAPGAADRARIARDCGFSSERQMREAMHRRNARRPPSREAVGGLS